MRTCPTSGLGISRSTISKSAPPLGICATFIVAINPPLNFSAIVEKHLLPLARRRTLLSARLPPHLENDFQLDGRAERKACDAIHQAARTLVSSEDVL